MQYQKEEEEEEHAKTMANDAPSPFPAFVLPGVMARFLQENPTLANQTLYTVTVGKNHDLTVVKLDHVGLFYPVNPDKSTNHDISVLDFFVKITLMLERYPSFKNAPALVNEGQPLWGLWWKSDDQNYRLISMYDNPTLSYMQGLSAQYNAVTGLISIL